MIFKKDTSLMDENCLYKLYQEFRHNKKNKLPDIIIQDQNKEEQDI